MVDLGRAPAVTYQNWSKQADCRVISLYEFAEGFEDLRHIRRLLQLGMGQMMDGSGVDWWDVLSLMIEPELRLLLLVGRLATDPQPGYVTYASRSTPLAPAVPLADSS